MFDFHVFQLFVLPVMEQTQAASSFLEDYLSKVLYILQNSIQSPPQ